MTIWIQQKLEFWEELESNGIVYCNEESWTYKMCNFAYDWLTAQMHIRISPPPMPEIKLPLWGWVQYRSHKYRKPTFTPYKDENGLYPQVLIEAEIPDELLLQSNFCLWESCCINGSEIGDTLNKDIEQFDATHNISERGFRAYPDELKQRIMKSWEFIFDLDYRNRRYYNRPRRKTPIQATFWLLRKEWVKDVRFFIPK